MSATLLSLLGTLIAFLLQLLGQIKDPHDPEAKGAKRKRIVKWISIPLLIVSLAIGGYSSIKSDGEKAKGAGQITGLTDSVKALQKVNETQHDQDLTALKSVNDQLAELKAGVKTEELRKKMGVLQGELDKYLNANPKVELQSGVWISQQEPLTSELYIPVEGTHAKFDIGIRNNTPTYAKNIEMWLAICADCAFLSEPKQSQMLPSDGPKVRYWRDINLAPHIGYNSTIDMDVPRQFTEMRLILRYACENCLQTTDRALTLTLGRTGLPFLKSPAKKIPPKPARKP